MVEQLNKQDRRQLTSDLRVAYGFSRKSADLALMLFEAGLLTTEEEKHINYLIKRKPFCVSSDEDLVVLAGSNQVFNHLNHKVS